MSVCYINKEDIEKIDIVNIKGGMTASDICKKYKPDYLINLALYDSLTSGINITFLEDENVQSGYLFSNEGIGIRGDNEILWVGKDEAYADDNIRDFVGGSPILVKNGIKSIDWGNKYSSYIDGKHVRSFVGFNDTQVILCSTDTSMYINAAANEAVRLGCKYAINCDGGGSSHLQYGDKIYRKSSRKNASWLLVYLKSSEDDTMKQFTNNSAKSLPVYETTACKKKIGSLDPYETCVQLYENNTYRVVMYSITGKAESKVGFVRK